MNCPSCGAANADDAAFCASCGANLQSAGGQPPLTAQPTTGGVGAKVTSAFNEGLALLRDPIGYMTRNKNNSTPLNSIIINYVAILALIPLVGRLIGDGIFYHAHGELGYAIAGSIVSYFLDIISVFIVGYVIWKLAPNFGSAADQVRGTLMAAYIYTPIFFIGILNIVPVLGYLAILGLLYGIYILYRGLPILVNTPADKTVIYTIAILVVSLIILIIISFIIGAFDTVAHV